MLKFICDPKSPALKTLINLFQPNVIPDSPSTSKILEDEDTQAVNNIHKIKPQQDKSEYKAMVSFHREFQNPDQLVNKFWLSTIMAEFNMD